MYLLKPHGHWCHWEVFIWALILNVASIFQPRHSVAKDDPLHSCTCKWGELF